MLQATRGSATKDAVTPDLRPAGTASAGAAAASAMTVDLEDWFQVSAFERHIRREDWERLPSRVERNAERILALFARRGVRATFFILGWIAERHPQLVRAIAEAGHEVASHGFSHVRVTEQEPEEFRRDVTHTRSVLEELSGRAVLGFRAASFSIGASNLWALDVLAEAGYRYSSSVYPVRHDFGGMPGAPRFPFRRGGDGLLEIPVTTVRVGRRNLPCGGGGYFRLFPYALSRWAIGRVTRGEGRPAVFYFHPWEIDPGQPRQQGLALKTRFRHYLNLERMERRLERLLADFRWGRMDEIFLGEEQGATVASGERQPGPSRHARSTG